MTVSLPTSFPGTGELSKLDTQTFSDGEILRRLTSSVSSALDEAASALNKIRSEAVTKEDLSSETNVNNGRIFPTRYTCTYVLVSVPGVWLCVCSYVYPCGCSLWWYRHSM